MRQLILPSLLITAMAYGSVSIYSVEPVDMAHSAFVQTAREDFAGKGSSLYS